MKKLALFFTCIALFFFFLSSCSDSSNPIHSQQNQISELTKGKPPKDDPEIEYVRIRDWDSPKTIPGDQVVVEYKIINAKIVDYYSIGFRYDHDCDGKYRTHYDPYVFSETINGNGNDIIEDTFIWNGTVQEDFSSDQDGYLFDQLATENPDQYLLSFSVSGRNFWAYNGQPADSQRVQINPENQVDPFWVTLVEVSSKTPAKKKDQKKYAAELLASITCSQEGFTVRGKWVQVFSPDSVGSIVHFDGCPHWTIRDDNNDGTASSCSCDLLVGLGKYRFYVKNVYSPNYSYNPWNEVQSNQWPWPAEPYAEVVVN